MTQNSQTWQLQALLGTYMYCTRVFIPAKTLNVRKIHINDLPGNWPTHLFVSVEQAYHKICTSTLLDFYMKQLLSLACVILDQCNCTHNCKSRNFLICWKPSSICLCEQVCMMGVGVDEQVCIKNTVKQV